MLNKNFKKLNSIIILFLLYISLKNITKFTDDSLEMPIENYGFQENEELVNFEYLENDLNTEDLETEINQSLKKRFELTKKNVLELENNSDLAYFNDTEIATDYVYNQNDASLNLIPIYETILFSGIPEPKNRPIPEKPEYVKSVTLSLKNKKMLLKNLENYIGKEKYKSVIDGMGDHFNYNIEENLTLHMDENDKVLEIQSLSKTFQSLNSRRDLNDNFVFFFEETPTERKVIRNRLKVKDSVSRTLKSSEIPTSIAKEFIQQLSYTIDFQRDVANGDIIDILYEADFTKNNNIVGNPDLLYGLMHLKDHKLELFKYTLSNGVTDYFDAFGKSIRKHLMRTPVQGARLSSKFGVRKHPILGYSKMHRGVDFAAKRGTPIMAAGDGRITFSGRNGAFGRFVEIKHLNNFKTGYAHLFKFASGIKKGKIVKQGDIIGYVGTSGRSTGPHLHYEVKHKNRTINPMKLRLQSTINVENQDMPNFYASISLTRERFLATQFKEAETAENF